MAEPVSYSAQAEALLREAYGPIRPAIIIGLRIADGIDRLNNTLLLIAQVLTERP